MNPEWAYQQIKENSYKKKQGVWLVYGEVMPSGEFTLKFKVDDLVDQMQEALGAGKQHVMFKGPLRGDRQLDIVEPLDNHPVLSALYPFMSHWDQQKFDKWRANSGPHPVT